MSYLKGAYDAVALSAPIFEAELNEFVPSGWYELMSREFCFFALSPVKFSVL
jgi:hypothetical protein